jgi:hypothetical protein
VQTTGVMYREGVLAIPLSQAELPIEPLGPHGVPASNGHASDDFSLADRVCHASVECRLSPLARARYSELGPELKTGIDRCVAGVLTDAKAMQRASDVLASFIFNPRSVVARRLNEATLAAVFEQMMFPERSPQPAKLERLHEAAEAALTLYEIRNEVKAPPPADQSMQTLQWTALGRVLATGLERINGGLESRRLGRDDFCDLTTLETCTRELMGDPKLQRSKNGLDELAMGASVRQAIIARFDLGSWVNEIEERLASAKTDEDLLRARHAAFDYLGAERRYQLVPETPRKRAQDELTAARIAFVAETKEKGRIFAPNAVVERLREAYPAWRSAQPQTRMEDLVDRIEARLSNPVESVLEQAAAHAAAGRYSLAAMVAQRAYAHPMDRLAPVEQPDVLQYELLAALQAGDPEKAFRTAGGLIRFAGQVPGKPIGQVMTDEQYEGSNDRQCRMKAIEDFLKCVWYAHRPDSNLTACAAWAKGMDWHTPYHGSMTRAFTAALTAGRKPQLPDDLGSALPDHPAFSILKRHLAEAITEAPIKLTPLEAVDPASSPGDLRLGVILERGERILPPELSRAVADLAVIVANNRKALRPNPHALQAEQFARERALRLMDRFRVEMIEASTLTEDEARLVALHIPLSDSVHATYGAEAIQRHMADALRWTNGVGFRHLHAVQSAGHGSFAHRERGQLNISSSRPTDEELRTDVFHEFGHHREYEDDDTKALMFAWRASRATTTTTAEWHGYPVFAGSFVTPYVGRDYGPLATEVLSVGLEHFCSTQSMLNLMLADASHFHLMIGLLRGYLDR